MTGGNKMEKFNEYNGQLTEVGFKTGIEMLSAYYMTFKFWQEEFQGQIEIRKRMWYSTFKNMSDGLFVKLIERYCNENIYAPQSPSHILEFSKQQLSLQQGKADEEFEKVRELNRRYSLRINYNTIYAKIDNPITVKLVKAMFEDFINMGEDNADFVRKRFIEKYNDLTREEAQIKANELLGTPQKKMLE